MNSQVFEQLVEEQIDICKKILLTKSHEYATDDRLHNFKVAAALQKESAKEALAGMMAKHIVSIYDMCRGEKLYSRAMWDEKITDSMNYLLLLKAIVIEDHCEDSREKHSL